MGNLEGWGGPMSRGMMESRARMQRRILARMAELGIEPVLQGFWGMVPNKLREKYPDARIVDQGLWGRIFPRPAILLPEDPLFDRMADRYYSVLRELYGDSVKYLGGDLFHEGGDTTGMHVTRTASLIQASMQRHFPGSKWMLQGWSGNPKKELLAGARSGIDRGHRPLRGERFDVAKHRGVLRHPVDLGHRKPFRRQDRYGRPAFR